MAYTNSGPVDVEVDFDSSRVKGLTAVVTGGANGIGEAYTRALVKAGAFVLVADLDEEFGNNLEKELGSSVKFVKTNVTVWADQVAAFKAALSASPSGRIDIVIANAGISGSDQVFVNDSDLDEPQEPRLTILNVNLTGVMFTIKLALFYFRKQHAANKGQALDQNLVLQGSLAGYLDLPGALQYSASKYGLRGLLKDLRRSEAPHGIRVNYIAPWFIKTKIISDAVAHHLESHNVEYATVEDAAQAVMRIVSDAKITGRSFGILPRSLASRGYLDLDFDDYPEDTLLGKLQVAAGGGDHRMKLSEQEQRTRTQWAETVTK